MRFSISVAVKFASQLLAERESGSILHVAQHRCYGKNRSDVSGMRQNPRQFIARIKADETGTVSAVSHFVHLRSVPSLQVRIVFDSGLQLNALSSSVCANCIRASSLLGPLRST